MEEVLHHALTLEALDKLRDVELRAMADRADHTNKGKKDKYAKVPGRTIQHAVLMLQDVVYRLHW